MPHSRRLFLKRLKLAGLSSLLSLPLPLWAGVFRFGGADPFAALPYWLDTLLPAGPGPGALALGVADTLTQKAGKEPRYAQLLTAGCQWLDQQAYVSRSLSFAELSAAQRVQIVQRAEKLPRRHVIKVFFLVSLQDGKQVYYSDPRSWTSLGINGAPQPAGFVDFAKSPAHG